MKQVVSTRSQKRAASVISHEWIDRVERQRMSLTEVISDWSDRLVQPFVLESARKYSEALQTPEHFIEMLLLIEDKRFPYHFGVDPIAIARALTFNLRGRSLQGASTISQQVYTIRRGTGAVPRGSRSLWLKVKQASWAISHSVVLSKVALLREYLQSVYWGKSLYGIDEAARAYFGARKETLSGAQSFFLAERIAAPNGFSQKRIVNLLRRRAVRAALRRSCTSLVEITELYRAVLNRGEMWLFQEK